MKLAEQCNLFKLPPFIFRIIKCYPPPPPLPSITSALTAKWLASCWLPNSQNYTEQCWADENCKSSFTMLIFFLHHFLEENNWIKSEPKKHWWDYGKTTVYLKYILRNKLWTTFKDSGGLLFQELAPILQGAFQKYLSWKLAQTGAMTQISMSKNLPTIHTCVLPPIVEQWPPLMWARISSNPFNSSSNCIIGVRMFSCDNIVYPMVMNTMYNCTSKLPIKCISLSAFCIYYTSVTKSLFIG